MSKGFFMKVQGLDAVLRNIEKVERKVAISIDRELSEAARNVAREAAATAPKESGKLIQSIKADASTKYNKSVSVGEFYAPFIEFGTGKRVFDGLFKFSSDQKAFARKFFVSGKGKMPSRAYLFPAYEKELERLKDRIKKVLFG
jgi:HK97 gp10 family phage protein